MKMRTWLNLPNALTLVRILLVPTLLLTYLNAPEEKRIVSLLLFLAAGLTDCLDGYIARRFKLVTMLGKVLDPIADKLMCAAVLFCLSWSGVLPWYVLPIIVIKELYMAVGTTICLRRKLEVASDIYGKLATALFYPAVLLAWPWHDVALLCRIGSALTYLSLALSIYAALHYTLDAIKQSNQSKARAED